MNELHATYIDGVCHLKRKVGTFKPPENAGILEHVFVPAIYENVFIGPMSRRKFDEVHRRTLSPKERRWDRALDRFLAIPYQPNSLYDFFIAQKRENEKAMTIP